MLIIRISAYHDDDDHDYYRAMRIMMHGMYVVDGMYFYQINHPYDVKMNNIIIIIIAVAQLLNAAEMMMNNNDGGAGRIIQQRIALQIAESLRIYEDDGAGRGSSS